MILSFVHQLELDHLDYYLFVGPLGVVVPGIVIHDCPEFWVVLKLSVKFPKHFLLLSLFKRKAVRHFQMSEISEHCTGVGSQSLQQTRLLKVRNREIKDLFTELKID